MKSLTQLIRSFQQSGRNGSRKRRLNERSGNRLVSVETVESRTLLTTIAEALYNPAVMNDIADTDLVTDYFVKFETVQNIGQLTNQTGAQSVTESQFVTNGYMLEFQGGRTMQQAVDILGDMPGFEYMHPDVPFQLVPDALPNDPLFTDQWHLLNTGQGNGQAGIDGNFQAAWDIATGSGVTIGIVDQGVETTHPDLLPNINTQLDFDWVDDDNDPNPTGATENHGVAVAGVAAAAGNNNLGVSGASWDAELVGLRLLGGPVSDQDVAEAITHFPQIIDIYNNSWGPGARDIIATFGSGPQTQAALLDGATNGRNGLGVIRVNSAGNGGQNSNTNYFAVSNSRHSIAVGALGNDGQLASYSTPGAPVVVVAPSNGGTLGITTTDRTGAAGYSQTDYANDFGGTSSAAPLVSGVVALMLEANPGLTYRDVVDILVHTSDQVDPNDASWDINGAGLPVSHDYGFGKVNAANAVSAALTHVSLAPEQTYASGTQVVNRQIPDLGSISETFTVTNANAISSLEWVEIEIDATHTWVGDLEIVLQSPDGTQSVLAESRVADNQTSISHTFTTIHHYGESSLGTWTLTITDGQAQDTGTLDSFELRFFGTNVAPVVQQSGGTTVVADSGTSDFFDVSLPTAPTQDVVIDVTSADTGEVTVDQARLTFTPANWQTPQRVTVTGVTDALDDGDQMTDVTVSVNAALSDAAYASAPDTVISVTSIDNDGNLPEKPTFLSPGQFPATASPMFQWTAGPNSRAFDLVVTNVFTGNVVQQRSGLLLPRHEFASPFVDGVYEAVARGINSDGVAGPWSDPLIFAIGEPAVPAAPVILSPAQSSTVTTNTPAIQWTPRPGATLYELYFLQSGSVTRILDAGTPTANGRLEYIPTTPLREGFNSVWIRGQNPFGAFGAWSNGVGFTVDAFAKPIAPVITAPIVTVTTNAFPQFRWLAPDSVRYELWVNEMPNSTNGLLSPRRVIHVTDLVHDEYTHFRPLNNATHRVWARGFNAVGEASDWSAFEEFTVSVPLPQPPVLDEVGDTQDQTPLLSWETQSGDDFHGGSTFNLWVNNLSTGEARVILETGLKTNSYVPVNPLPQGRYGVWVQTVSAIGVKSVWSPRMVMNIDQPAPSITQLVAPVAAQGATDVENDMPTFSWDPSIGAATYELWVNHVDSRTTRILHETALEELTYTPTQGLPQGTFNAWVRAFNSAGEAGEWSARFDFSIDVPLPRTPTITGPATNAVNRVPVSSPKITWTSLLPDSADTYELQLEEEATGTQIVNETGIEEQEFVVPFRLAETVYRVRVRAVNSAGETSAWSAWSTFRVDIPNATTPVLYAPTGTITSEPITFQWQHTAENVRYEILVRDELNGETIRIQKETFQLNITGDRAVYTTDELDPGTYRFWIRAFNAQDTPSGWSNSLAFTLIASTSEAESELDVQLILTSLEKREDSADVEAAAPAAADVQAEAPEVKAQHRHFVSTPEQAPAHVEILEAVMAEFAETAFVDESA